MSGRRKWNQRYSESPGSWLEPDSFLIRAYDEFLRDAQPGVALDLAGGAGRNSLFLLHHGWQVNLVDISDIGLHMAREKERQHRQECLCHTAFAKAPVLTIQQLDLDKVADLGASKYDLILAFYFLRRELFPAIVRALRPGGALIYRTYTVDRMKVPGGPSDPAYLLQPNELLHAFSHMHVLHYHEMVEGKAAAELVARK